MQQVMELNIASVKHFSSCFGFSVRDRVDSDEDADSVTVSELELYVGCC